jgi:hypothetical protein
MTTRSRAFQEPQEPCDYFVWVVEALSRIEVLNEPDAELPEGPVPGMILDGTRGWVKGLTVDLQNSPLSVATDQEVGLAILPRCGRPEPAATIGKEEHSCPVKGLGDPNLALGPKVEVVPDS